MFGPAASAEFTDCRFRHNAASAMSLPAQSVRTATIVGSSSGWPVRAERECSQGTHEWVVRFQGQNSAAIGVASSSWSNSRSGREHRRSIQTTSFASNPSCFGMRLNGRGVFSGGKTTERKKGPDSFPVPCTVTLRLDCDAGALALAHRETVAFLDAVLARLIV